MKVYLDNGATTMVAKEVLNVMQPYFTKRYGNASSLHSFGQEAQHALDKARETIAKLINAEPEEVIFTSGGTESDNLAIKGIAYANKDKGNHIITTNFEHHAVEEACKSLEKEGFNVTWLDVTKEGFVKPEDVKKAITRQTIMVSVMHANNEIGTIQPIAEIGKICSEKRVYFHTDAVQSLTKTPIDVKKMHIDLASFSSHKIHGPKGVGALYIKKGTKIKPQALGGPHEFKKRAGTENIPGIVGFARAATLVTKQDINKMYKLRDYLIEGLLKIPNTQLNGSRQNRLCNNVNIVFNFVEGEAMLLHLNMRGIAVSTGSACSSHDLKPSHVLLAIGLRPEVAHGSIRFTLSKYTTKQEIDYTIKNVKEVVEQLRKMSPLKKGYEKGLVMMDKPEH